MLNDILLLCHVLDHFDSSFLALFDCSPCSGQVGNTNSKLGPNWPIIWDILGNTLINVLAEKEPINLFLKMWNYCFKVHLYCRYKSLPEDLVCQHGQLHHVFPKRERKCLEPETRFTFLHIFQTNKDCFAFLTTGPVDPILPLSPCMPAGP